MVYGAANPAFTGTLATVIGTDGIMATYASAATAATPVGSYSTIALGIVPTLVDPNSRQSNYAVTFVDGTLTITGLPQVITGFNAFGTVTYGNAPIALSASGGGSGNAVTFSSSDPTVATISGTTLTITGAGTATITANQALGGNYAAAAPLPQTLTVGAAPLLVTATSASRVYGIANPAFTGTLATVIGTDGIMATYASAATAATPVGSYSTIALGIVPTVVDPNNRQSNYAVTLVDGTLTISGLPQVITGFTAFGTVTYGAAPFAITGVTGGGSNNAVTFSSNNSAVATIAGDIITITGAGTTLITANQSAGNTYTAAAPQTQSLNVLPAPLTITAMSLGMTVGGSVPALTATYAGFVNGDGVTNLSMPAVLSTTATSASPVGTYPITVSGATDPNYTFTMVAGILTVDNPGGGGSTPITPHETGGSGCGIGSGVGAFAGLSFLLLRAYLGMMARRRKERK